MSKYFWIPVGIIVGGAGIYFLGEIGYEKIQTMPGNAPVVMWYVAIRNWLPRSLRVWIFTGDDIPQHPDWLEPENPWDKDVATNHDTETARKSFDKNSPTANYPPEYHTYFKKTSHDDIPGDY
jgi:hypothetical protein